MTKQFICTGFAGTMFSITLFGFVFSQSPLLGVFSMMWLAILGLLLWKV